MIYVFLFTDLFHSVWQFLGPFTSQKMVQFWSFFYGWGIFHYVYVLHLLYSFLCWHLGWGSHMYASTSYSLRVSLSEWDLQRRYRVYVSDNNKINEKPIALWGMPTNILTKNRETLQINWYKNMLEWLEPLNFIIIAHFSELRSPKQARSRSN